MDNRPPMDETASDLVTQLMKRPRPSDVVDWPGEPIPGYEKIRVIVPADESYTTARLAARKRMTDLKIPQSEWDSELNAGILGDLIAKEMLAIVCYIDRKRPDGSTYHQRVFHDAKDIEKALSKQEISVLWDSFLMIEHRLGPRFEVLSPDEVDIWIERLRDGLSPLARLVLPDLVELIRGLHQKIVSMTEFSGSPTLEPQLLSSPNTSASPDLGSSATDTSYSGEQPAL